MTKSVIKFGFENLSDHVITLEIEPWADAEQLGPNEKASFECEEFLDLEITYLGQETASIFVRGARVTVKTKAGQRDFSQASGGWFTTD